MEQKPSGQKHKGNIADYLWLFSISIGIALGAGIGAAIDSIGSGIGIGTAVGVAVGFVLYRKFISNSGDD